MTDPKDQLSPKWPTIFQLASTIGEQDLSRAVPQGRKNALPITHNLVPKPFPATEGYMIVTPEQLTSLRVPVIEVSDTVKGFQREKINQHVRKIAKAMHDGDEMPPIILSIFPDGNVYVDDGQHRALAAIMARKPLEAVVKRRTVEQARKLFAAQGRAKTLRTDDMLLTGDSILELYIQDALTCDTHPWSGLVTTGRSTQSRMTPTTMANIVGAFAFNAIHQGTAQYTSRPESEFDQRAADLLAELVRSFGNRATNPFAFRGRVLRAVAHAAVHIFRRNPNSRADDVERWHRHMPAFDFAKYPHLLSKEVELTLELVNHWNKRLPEERRVRPYNYA